MSKSSAKVLHGWYGDPQDSLNEIIDALGDISGIQLAGYNVLIAYYIRPTVTRGGIITKEETQIEDVYQGTVGLVVKTGPLAFKDEGTIKSWNGSPPTIGEFVYFRSQDGIRCSIKGEGSVNKDREFVGWHCSLVMARDIQARTMRPHEIV